MEMTEREILLALLDEQIKTNQLLLLLVQTLGEEDSDPDAEPATYMDGIPCP